MSDILKRAWPYLACLAVLLVINYGTYRHGVTTTTDRYERLLAEHREAGALALAKAQAETRDKEQQAARAQASIETAYLQGQKDAQANTDRTIADLRAGNIRLRNELASAQCAIDGVSTIASGAGQRHAACSGGLREEHARFLIHFADRADQVARQLQAAQEVIVNDRLICAGAPN